MELNITVPEGYTWYFLDNPPSDVDDRLHSELSFQIPNAEYSDSYQDGSWDGFVHLYKKQHNGAPVGLLDRTVDILEQMGHEVNVTIEGDRKGSPVNLTWNFEHDLRDYQTEAVEAVIDNTGGIVGLPTGTGKTVVGLRLLFKLAMSSGRGIVFVHTQELLYQWADQVREILDVEPGLIGDGNWSEGPVTICIMQTLMSRGPDSLEKDYGVMIFDECHRTSAADVMHDIGMEIDTEFRIGLSATPWRRVAGEELKIEAAVGGEVYSVSSDQMIDDGYLSVPRFDIVEEGASRAVGDGDYHEAYFRCIATDPKRNSNVTRKTADLAADGRKVLVNVTRIAHGQLLRYALNTSVEPGDLDVSDLEHEQKVDFIECVDTLQQYDCNAEFLHGSDSTQRRKEVLDDFENGDLDVLVSTLLKEGVDIPEINAIVLAQAGKSDIAQIQTIGRALRPSNGEDAVIVDFKDDGRYFRNQHYERMKAMKDYYGEYGPEGASGALTEDPPTFDEVFGDG